MPSIVTRPPRGRRGETVNGGVEPTEETSIPSVESASSRGPTGRRWKYFWPLTVTGASASEASPIMK